MVSQKRKDSKMIHLARINVDGKTTKADWLDLMLTLQDMKVNKVIAIYKENGKINTKLRNVYQRDNQGRLWMIMNRGNACNKRVQVIQENKQLLLQIL